MKKVGECEVPEVVIVTKAEALTHAVGGCLATWNPGNTSWYWQHISKRQLAL